MYNKFNYTLRTSPQEVKDYYKSLLTKKDQAAINEFVEELIQMGPNMPSDYIRRKRKLSEEKENEAETEWVSWKKGAEEEGHDNLLEMVEANTIPSKVNPKLPPNSKIQYPTTFWCSSSGTGTSPDTRQAS